jgi:hypothetical protein
VVVGGGDPLVAPAGRVPAHVERLGSGEQLPAQHRVEGLRVDRGAEARGDVLGRGVGLLGSDRALPDG